jgi:hypothetical protein
MQKHERKNMTSIVKILIGYRARACALALALHLTSPIAFAQYNNMFSSGLGYNTPSMAYAAMVQQQMQQNAYFQSQLAAKTQPAPSAKAQAAPSATNRTTPLLRAAPHVFKYPLSATDFTPSGKRNTPEQFTANAKTPQERAQVADMCRTILRTMEAQPGVRKNNLSTALTVLLGISMQVSTGREFTDPESEGLQRTINDVLVDTAGHKALSNEKRTAVYDALMITGGLIAAMAQNATESGNAAELQRATDLARQSVAMFMR